MEAAIVGFLIVVLFALALAWPSVQAYRGRYRSWTYRGLGTRYGAFAVGWTAAGLIGVVAGGMLEDEFGTAGRIVGAIGLLAMVAGLAFFIWMPPFLVPRWRRELLKNAKLYRKGDPNARLNATPISSALPEVVVWHRNAPVVDSEWLALSVSGMHARPRTRLPGILRGPLPDRATGIAGGTISEVEGELIGDDGVAVFAQSPSEDARHWDNWFAVMQPTPGADDVTAGKVASDGATTPTVVNLGTTPGQGPIEFITTADAEHVDHALTDADRTRRVRHTTEGHFHRSERIAAP